MYDIKVLGRCPLCGGDVIEKKKSYGCANWRQTKCEYTIWKENFGHKLTDNEAKLIIEGRETDPVELKSIRTGRSYYASLYYDNDTGKVRFRYGDENNRDTGFEDS